MPPPKIESGFQKRKDKEAKPEREKLGRQSWIPDTWILDLLTTRPQVVRVGRHTSKPLPLNTGSPRPASSAPYCTPCTHMTVWPGSAPTPSTPSVDDTVVVGLISNHDEKAYLEEVADLSLWCQDSSLLMNVPKTKELIVDFRRARQRTYTPLWINGTTVERVSSYKYLGVYITEDLTWATHTDTLLKKFRVSLRILQSFYSGAAESLLTGSIIAWFGNSFAQERRALQRAVRSAERTIGTTFPSLQD
ncbi:hypothetical protein N1851_006466 [Merluccius polli]|uniref:Alkylated DNA repair protein AlkB homologue 8 N-terminal domain-containing protein n=1 Tax=Merluccius polli TaxID=89951 RepID=A0AA47N5U2_MERPO|nr:hypothetical protein N1851_006466 [Merluccius polli]